MRRANPKDEKTRFSGGMRHYHRTGVPQRPSWEEWVDGAGATRKNALKWLRFLGIVIAFLALGAIIAGLFVELR